MGLSDLFKKNPIQLAKLEQKTDQEIFNILLECLPDNWQEIVFFAGYYADDCAYFKYWVKQENGSYIDCFTLIPQPLPNETDLLQLQLLRINQLLKDYRSKLKSKYKWVCLEMTITNEGRLEKNYDYANGVDASDYNQFVIDYKERLNEKFSG